MNRMYLLASNKNSSFANIQVVQTKIVLRSSYEISPPPVASAGPAVAVVGVACAASQACAAVGDRELPVKHLPRVVTVHSLQLI